MTINKKFLISALLAVMFVSLMFVTKLDLINILDSSSVYPTLVFAAFTIIVSFRFFYKFSDFKKRDKTIALISSFFLSVFYVFGHQLDSMDDLTLGLKTVVSIGIMFAFYTIIILNLLDKKDAISNFDFKYDVKFLDKLFTKYVFVWLLIFILTIPYIVFLNPGGISSDSYSILMQTTGGIQLTSGHPIFYTLFVKLIYTITSFLNLSMYYTVLFVSIIQALVMSAIYAYAVYTLYKLKCKFYYVILLLAFYGVFPLFPVYSVTLWKDVMFSGMILLYTIYLYKAKTDDDFLNNTKKLMILSAITLGVLLFRTNGILVVVMSLPFILIILKKSFVKILTVTIVPIILYILFITVGFDMIGVEPFRKTEAFTVPYQHLARIYTQEDNLSVEDEEFMEKVFTKQSDRSIYSPRVSNNSRAYSANVEYFENNTDEFFENWFRLVKKYPTTLVKSFLNNNFGYWYPEVTHYSVNPWVNDNERFLIYEPQLESIERKFDYMELGVRGVVFFMYNTISKRITSVGLFSTILGVLFLIKVSQKNSKASILFIPSFMLWLGIILGTPVYADFRYASGIYASLPFIIGVVLFCSNNALKDTAGVDSKTTAQLK